jgi:hypothetical protein
MIATLRVGEDGRVRDVAVKENTAEAVSKQGCSR